MNTDFYIYLPDSLTSWPTLLFFVVWADNSLRWWFVLLQTCFLRCTLLLEHIRFSRVYHDWQICIAQVLENIFLQIVCQKQAGMIQVDLKPLTMRHTVKHRRSVAVPVNNGVLSDLVLKALIIPISYRQLPDTESSTSNRLVDATVACMSGVW